MNILILGAGGFIGSHLTEQLVTEEFEVVGVDINNDKIPSDIIDRIDFHKCDIRDNHYLLADLIKAADIVVDLIAYANPSIYLRSPLEVVQLNFFENYHIMERCLEFGKRLVQFSTCEVYGMTGGSDCPFKEDATPLIMGPIRYHRWIYACGKQFLERIIHANGLMNNLDYTVIRPFNFIGPRIDYLVEKLENGIPRVFSMFLSALMGGEDLVLVDGGKNQRCFTYIEDAIDAVMLVLLNTRHRFNKEIVNIGNPGNETDMAGLAKVMKEIYADITGRESLSEVKLLEGEIFYGIGYQDCDRRIPDISKLTECGWKPKYDLVRTLRKSMEYYLSH